MISDEKLKIILEEFKKPREEFKGLSYIDKRRERFDNPMEKEIKPLLKREKIRKFFYGRSNKNLQKNDSWWTEVISKILLNKMVSKKLEIH